MPPKVFGWGQVARYECPDWVLGYWVTKRQRRYAAVGWGQSLRVCWRSFGSQPKPEAAFHEPMRDGLPEGPTAVGCFRADQDNYPARISTEEVFLHLERAKNGEMVGWSSQRAAASESGRRDWTVAFARGRHTSRSWHSKKKLWQRWKGLGYSLGRKVVQRHTVAAWRLPDVALRPLHPLR